MRMIALAVLALSLTACNPPPEPPATPRPNRRRTPPPPPRPRRMPAPTTIPVLIRRREAMRFYPHITDQIAHFAVAGEQTVFVVQKEAA